MSGWQCDAFPDYSNSTHSLVVACFMALFALPTRYLLRNLFEHANDCGAPTIMLTWRGVPSYLFGNMNWNFADPWPTNKFGTFSFLFTRLQNEKEYIFAYALLQRLWRSCCGGGGGAGRAQPAAPLRYASGGDGAGGGVGEEAGDRMTALPLSRLGTVPSLGALAPGGNLRSPKSPGGGSKESGTSLSGSAASSAANVAVSPGGSSQDSKISLHLLQGGTKLGQFARITAWRQKQQERRGWGRSSSTGVGKYSRAAMTPASSAPSLPPPDGSPAAPATAWRRAGASDTGWSDEDHGSPSPTAKRGSGQLGSFSGGGSARGGSKWNRLRTAMVVVRKRKAPMAARSASSLGTRLIAAAGTTNADGSHARLLALPRPPAAASSMWTSRGINNNNNNNKPTTTT